MANDKTLDKKSNDSVQKANARHHVAPPVDVYENKDEILILADLPGVTKESLSIQLEKSELVITGPRPDSRGDDAFDFRRTFVVPQGIEAEKVTATLQNGVLRVVLPKPSALKPRQIAVTAG